MSWAIFQGGEKQIENQLFVLNLTDEILGLQEFHSKI